MIKNNFWTNKTVLVTGAGGFIASHLVETLVKEGAFVKAFVRYNSRNDYGLISLLPHHIRQNIEVVAGDLRDPQAVITAASGVSHIFHLGALIAIHCSVPKDVLNRS